MTMLRKHGSGERGATMILVAVALMAILGVAAIAVDLSAMRSDRSADQKMTDTAAAAGALTVAKGGSGQDACENALAYVAINAESIGSIDDFGCAAAFSSVCTPTVAESHSVAVGRYVVTVTYPVPDDHELMTSGALGAPGQPLVPEDREPCERVGVQVSADHDSFFAQVLGRTVATTEVHTVATAGPPDGPGIPINLLVLNRTACQTIVVSGNGGVIVDAVLNPDGGGPGVPALEQGILAADSDGSGCSTSGVINVSGSGSVIRADGPAGCSNQTGTEVVAGSYMKGLGCGLVMTMAPGTPGCNPPACVAGGGGNAPNPLPTRLPARLTRAPVDYRYNCKPDYTTINSSLSWATAPLTVANGQDIPPCPEPTATHIHDLIASVGQTGMPSGFQRWTAAGYGCNLPSSASPIEVTGNWWIDCAGGGGFSVANQVTIRGSVVFDGKVSVGAGGHLAVRNTLGSPGFAFLRNGELSKAGQGSLTFMYTTVYASRTSSVKLSGGSGSLIWVAPDLEGHKFDDLSLWSDSPLGHSWAGQADLRMEGIFFTPLATAEYSGGAGQNTSNAQWIADKLVATGQGALHVRPSFGRAIEFPLDPQTTLIR